jgi:uncharacterized protein YgfB (UPF0149 family)
MALKEIWVDKVDGVDDVIAEDINNIAQSVIDLEENVENFDEALDELHAYAEALKGGVA